MNEQTWQGPFWNAYKERSGSDTAQGHASQSCRTHVHAAAQSVARAMSTLRRPFGVSVRKGKGDQADLGCVACLHRCVRVCAEGADSTAVVAGESEAAGDGGFGDAGCTTLEFTLTLLQPSRQKRSWGAGREISDTPGRLRCLHWGNQY